MHDRKPATASPTDKGTLEVVVVYPLLLAGLVVGRQRPQTASGVIFVTLEDEFGMVNVVVWHDLAELVCDNGANRCCD